MLIDDLLGEDVDPALEGALVVFNARRTPTTTGRRRISPAAVSRSTPALANGADPVVKTTTWDAARRPGDGLTV